MDPKALFEPTPHPVHLGPDGSPWPLCPCGEFQATSTGWAGWRGCPCGAATGEITSLGTPHWQLQDRALINQRHEARRERRGR